jgi:hypothetical protein
MRALKRARPSLRADDLEAPVGPKDCSPRRSYGRHGRSRRSDFGLRPTGPVVDETSWVSRMPWSQVQRGDALLELSKRRDVGPRRGGDRVGQGHFSGLLLGRAEYGEGGCRQEDRKDPPADFHNSLGEGQGFFRDRRRLVCTDRAPSEIGGQDISRPRRRKARRIRTRGPWTLGRHARIDIPVPTSSPGVL